MQLKIPATLIEDLIKQRTPAHHDLVEGSGLTKIIVVKQYRWSHYACIHGGA